MNNSLNAFFVVQTFEWYCIKLTIRDICSNLDNYENFTQVHVLLGMEGSRDHKIGRRVIKCGDMCEYHTLSFHIVWPGRDGKKRPKKLLLFFFIVKNCGIRELLAVLLIPWWPMASWLPTFCIWTWRCGIVEYMNWKSLSTIIYWNINIMHILYVVLYGLLLVQQFSMVISRIFSAWRIVWFYMHLFRCTRKRMKGQRDDMNLISLHYFSS